MNLAILKAVNNPTVLKLGGKLAKYAPHILTGVGVTAVVAGSVITARAAAKHQSTLSAVHSDRVQLVKVGRENAVSTGDDEKVKTYGKDLTLAYARNSVDYIKVYGPGVSLTLSGIVAILAAHGLMQRRVVVLTGAVKALESSFNAYRQRVIEKYGEDVDRDFRLGFTKETETDPETGKKTTRRAIDVDGVSLYGKWFDEANENWRKDPDWNLAFIKNQQNWANDRLRIQGFLFLHEVYESLGIPTTPQAQVTGWVMDEDGVGDNYVDFDIYNADNRGFVNGAEPRVFLDFNVDGVILDRI